MSVDVAEATATVQELTVRERNAAVRDLMARLFPGVRFTVRNGTGGCARVLWTDGPLRQDVWEESLYAFEAAYPRRRWGVQFTRSVSDEVYAVQALRARSSGRQVYAGTVVATGEPVQPGQVLPYSQVAVAYWWDGPEIDPGTITADERRFAQALLELTGPLDGFDYVSDRLIRIAAAVFHYADALEGALA